MFHVQSNTTVKRRDSLEYSQKLSCVTISKQPSCCVICKTHSGRQPFNIPPVVYKIRKRIHSFRLVFLFSPWARILIDAFFPALLLWLITLFWAGFDTLSWLNWTNILLLSCNLRWIFVLFCVIPAGAGFEFRARAKNFAARYLSPHAFLSMSLEWERAFN